MDFLEKFRTIEKDANLDVNTTIDYQKKREQLYREMVLKSREQGVLPVTLENVVAGLKFIAENQDISQTELVKGLLELGCNYTYEDIVNLAKDDENKSDSSSCNLVWGVTVIINMRDHASTRRQCEERCLTQDNETSVYHFIRMATGDVDYKKSNIVKSLSK